MSGLPDVVNVQTAGTLECAIALMDIAGRQHDRATQIRDSKHSMSYADLAHKLTALAELNIDLATRIIEHHLAIMPTRPGSPQAPDTPPPAGGPRNLLADLRPAKGASQQ